MSQRYNDVSGQTNIDGVCYPWRSVGLAVVIILLLATLACGIFDVEPTTSSKRVVIQSRLPTLTPTAISGAVNEGIVDQPTISVPVQSPQSTNGLAAQNSAEATPVPLPTSTLALTPPPAAEQIEPPANNNPVSSHPPVANAIPEAEINAPGWNVAGLRLSTDQYEDRVVLYGDLVNNTGAAQELDNIAGTFYNAQGQVIAYEESTVDSWPLDIIPPGARMPFGLTIQGVQNAANFDLNIYSEPSDQIARQNFEFLDPKSSSETGKYCVNGQLRNLGGELEDYLVMVMVLYDEQNKIINFDEYPEPYFEELVGGETLPFEICADNFNQIVARYDLRAWGL